MGGEKRYSGGGGDGRDNKRQKKQYLGGRGRGNFNRSQIQKSVGSDRLRTPGIRGLLVSCDTKVEPMCVVEAMMAFKEHAQRRYPDLFPSNEDNEAPAAAGVVDIEKAIAAEAEKEKADKKSHFQSIKTDVKGLVFVEFLTAAMNPTDVCMDIMNDVKATGRTKTKYAVRITPVMATCYARVDEIVKAAQPIIDQHIGADTKETTYSIVFRKRSNDEVDRMDVIDKVAALVDKKHKVDLSTPEKCILVDVLTNTCVLGIVDNWMGFKKYNVMELCKPDSEALSGGRVQKDEPKSEKKEEKDDDKKEKSEEATSEK